MDSKPSKILLSALLAVMTSVSAVGCLISGFDLKIEQVPMIVMVAGLFALVGAIGFSFCHGGAVVLGITAMASLFFWGGGEAQTQTQALITRISYTYDQAYQWGVVRFPGVWYGVKADLPMMIAAALIALLVTWVICRRRPTVIALLAAFSMLLPCLVVTDTTPNGACLFFLLVGMVTLLLTSSARKHDPSRAPRRTWLSVAAVTAAVAVLFMAVPQKGYRNPFSSVQDQILEMLGFEGAGSGGSGGEIDGVDLKGLGSRFFLQYPVLTVTAPEDGVLYLREQDMNIYTGYSWESDEEREDGIASMPYGKDVASQKLTIETRWFRQRLLVPYYVTGTIKLTDGGVANTEKDMTYSWSVVKAEDDWRALVPNVTAEPYESYEYWNDVIQGKYYRSMPAETRGWAENLLTTILTDEQSATAKADTIAQYVRTMATYEDDCQRMPSSKQDFARWFIEDGESGYCVHFATSAAVLLRAAGVNTRYVTGYMTEVEANVPTVVTADMEHAWVEYYEPALKRWIVLEATPPEPEKQEETETTAVTTTTTQQTENTTRPTQPTQPDEAGTVIPWREIVAVVGKILLWVSAAAAVVFAVIGQRRLRETRRNRRWQQSSQNERALMLWHEIGRMGRRVGMVPPETLYALAQKAKFSQHTLTDEELRTLSDERDALMAILRTRDGLTKFVHRYILRLY